jgi:hypothetical protein
MAGEDKNNVFNMSRWREKKKTMFLICPDGGRRKKQCFLICPDGGRR